MFYKQFSAITKVLNPDFVESFDYWLATLPLRSQKNITVSLVSSRLGVQYTLAEFILKFAEEQQILKRQYEVHCPECDSSLGTYNKDDLAEILMESQYCPECDEYRSITPQDVYVTYKVVLKPNVSEAEIARAIEKRLNQGGGTQSNFSKADSLSNDPISLYEIFYNPSESAYSKFKELRAKLDLDYGDNKTAKGKALEVLILEIFNQIKCVRGTNDVKTETNQFDCTLLCGVDTVYPSVFNYLAPCFIIECKNEKKKPDNTYMNKLESVMDTNDAQFGIVFGRKDATSPCFTISREHYLTKKYLKQQQIIVTCCDKDLNYIIDKEVNLLQYIEFKIFQITSNSPTSTFEMFNKKSNTNS